MKKILFLFFCLSLGFASCSSDGDSDITPYLNIENESIIIPYNSLTASINIKTNEDWYIVNNSDWGKIENMSGKGDANIIFLCRTNDSSKERKTTITIKTASFNKEISIIQNGDNNFKQGPFAILKSSTVYAKYISSTGIFSPYSGVISPHWDGVKDTELSYRGNRDNKPVLEVFLSIKAQISTSSWMTIFLNDSKENMTIEDGKESFLKPYSIVFDGNPYTGSPILTNVDNENLNTSRDGNIISYSFTNFKASYEKVGYYLLDGKMEFELIE